MRQEKSIEQIALEFEEQQYRIKGKKAKECRERGQKMTIATKAVDKLYKTKEKSYV